MFDSIKIETLRTKEELLNYFKDKGQSITEEEIEELKQNYKYAEESSNLLSLQQLNNIAGGVTFQYKHEQFVKYKVVEGTENQPGIFHTNAIGELHEASLVNLSKILKENPQLSDSFHAFYAFQKGDEIEGIENLQNSSVLHCRIDGRDTVLVPGKGKYNLESKDKTGRDNEVIFLSNENGLHFALYQGKLFEQHPSDSTKYWNNSGNLCIHDKVEYTLHEPHPGDPPAAVAAAAAITAESTPLLKDVHSSPQPITESLLTEGFSQFKYDLTPSANELFHIRKNSDGRYCVGSNQYANAQIEVIDGHKCLHFSDRKALDGDETGLKAIYEDLYYLMDGEKNEKILITNDSQVLAITDIALVKIAESIKGKGIQLGGSIICGGVDFKYEGISENHIVISFIGKDGHREEKYVNPGDMLFPDSQVLCGSSKQVCAFGDKLKNLPDDTKEIILGAEFTKKRTHEDETVFSPDGCHYFGSSGELYMLDYRPAEGYESAFGVGIFEPMCALIGDELKYVPVGTKITKLGADFTKEGSFMDNTVFSFDGYVCKEYRDSSGEFYMRKYNITGEVQLYDPMCALVGKELQGLKDGEMKIIFGIEFTKEGTHEGKIIFSFDDDSGKLCYNSSGDCYWEHGKISEHMRELMREELSRLEDGEEMKKFGIKFKKLHPGSYFYIHESERFEKGPYDWRLPRGLIFDKNMSSPKSA